MNKPCDTCDGCGKVADSQAQEPWTHWMALPVESLSAVMAGLVNPITCPTCNGTGKKGGAR